MRRSSISLATCRRRLLQLCFLPTQNFSKTSDGMRTQEEGAGGGCRTSHRHRVLAKLAEERVKLLRTAAKVAMLHLRSMACSTTLSYPLADYHRFAGNDGPKVSSQAELVSGLGNLAFLSRSHSQRSSRSPSAATRATTAMSSSEPNPA